MRDLVTVANLKKEWQIVLSVPLMVLGVGLVQSKWFSVLVVGVMGLILIVTGLLLRATLEDGKRSLDMTLDTVKELRLLTSAYAITSSYGQEMRNIFGEVLPLLARYNKTESEAFASRLLGAQMMYLALHPDGEPDAEDAKEQFELLTTPAPGPKLPHDFSV